MADEQERNDQQDQQKQQQNPGQQQQQGDTRRDVETEKSGGEGQSLGREGQADTSREGKDE